MPVPSSCQEVSQSEKRLFVLVIDPRTLLLANDCNLSILAAPAPLAQLEVTLLWRMPAGPGSVCKWGRSMASEGLWVACSLFLARMGVVGGRDGERTEAAW